VAKYIGGSDVALSLQGVSGDVATYAGTVSVPRSVLCDDAPTTLRFRALASKGNGDTRGEGSFTISSVPGQHTGSEQTGDTGNPTSGDTPSGETSPPPPGDQPPNTGQSDAQSTDDHYVVTASTATPEVDCSSDDDPITVNITATVQYSGLGQPTTVVAKYIGGTDVTLTFQGASGDVATYTGSVQVPLSLLCKDYASSLRFRVLASDADTRGEGSFNVTGSGDEEPPPPPPPPPADARYLVTASTSTPTINCTDDTDDAFVVQVTALVNYRLLGRPTLVVAKYIPGGADVVLAFQGANGDIATYTGSLKVPRSALCDDPPTTLRFRVLATDADTRGEGVFFVTSVAPPSEGSGQP
jgi:hypothetical protein